MTVTIWAARKAQGPPLRIEIGEFRRGRLLGAMPSELFDSARKSVAPVVGITYELSAVGWFTGDDKSALWTAIRLGR